MSFLQSEFLLFFAVVVVTCRVLPHRAQNAFLVAASLVFAGWIHPWFAAVLLGTATVHHWAAHGMARHPRHKRSFLALALGLAALNLVVFKYQGFLVENADGALRALGVRSQLPVLQVLMPIGLSFWTLQTVGYVIDVYRGRAPCERWVDYALFVVFFPQLASGPIGRSHHLLPQIEAPRTVTAALIRSGVSLALFGAFKKVVVADTIGPYVDALYARPDLSAVAAWAAVVAFMVQVLADFSGYTDIARGCARILGFDLEENYLHPYLARSPIELWQRWHVTLARWLGDYVFMPLVTWKWARTWLRIPFVPESGLVAQVRATLITLLISGLWHGAGWHYLLWGLVWGSAQSAWLVGRRVVPRSWLKAEKSYWMVLIMLPMGAVIDQLFREPSPARWWGYMTLRPPLVDPTEWAMARSALALGLVGAAFLTVAMFVEDEVLPRLPPTWRDTLELAAWPLAFLAILVFVPSTPTSFVYFQF